MTMYLLWWLSKILRRKSDSSSISYETIHTSTAEPYIKGLINDISKTHQTLDIVENIDNIWVYEDERVKCALSDAINRGVKIRVIVTPMCECGVE